MDAGKEISPTPTLPCREGVPDELGHSGNLSSSHSQLTTSDSFHHGYSLIDKEGVEAERIVCAGGVGDKRGYFERF